MAEIGGVVWGVRSKKVDPTIQKSSWPIAAPSLAAQLSSCLLQLVEVARQPSQHAWRGFFIGMER